MTTVSKASVGGLAAVGAVAVVGAIAYGVPAIASAASSSPSPAPRSASAPGLRSHPTAETELSGATAAKVKAAVLAKLPGATVERMSAEDARPGTGAAYEAHVRTSDGSPAEVLLDKSYRVTAVRSGGFGRGGRHGGAERGLTGAMASNVKAAVLATVPGATVNRMSAENAAEGTGAAYEAHLTRSDGTHAEALLDKNFKVITTRSAPAGKRHFGGPPAGAPGNGGAPSPGGSGTSAGPADYQPINA